MLQPHPNSAVYALKNDRFCREQLDVRRSTAKASAFEAAAAPSADIDPVELIPAYKQELVVTRGGVGGEEPTLLAAEFQSDAMPTAKYSTSSRAYISEESHKLAAFATHRDFTGSPLNVDPSMRDGWREEMIRCFGARPEIREMARAELLIQPESRFRLVLGQQGAAPGIRRSLR